MSDSQTAALSPLFPRRKVPILRVPLAGGGAFDLAGERPQHFTLIVFYRGLHCPICKMQLKDLEAKVSKFARRGVGVVAISSDAKVNDSSRCDSGARALGSDRCSIDRRGDRV